MIITPPLDASEKRRRENRQYIPLLQILPSRTHLRSIHCVSGKSFSQTPNNPLGPVAFLPLNTPALAAGIHPRQTVISVTPPSSTWRLINVFTSSEVSAFGSGPGTISISSLPGATSAEDKPASMCRLAPAVHGVSVPVLNGEM